MGNFLVCFVAFFSIFWKLFFFLKFCTYILRCTPLVLRLKISMGFFTLCWSYLRFLWGKERNIRYFSLFLKNFAITLTITDTKMWYVAFAIQGHFRVIYDPLLSITQSSLSREIRNILMFCTDFLGITLMSLSKKSF